MSHPIGDLVACNVAYFKFAGADAGTGHTLQAGAGITLFTPPFLYREKKLV